ncbi:MAG: BLUF domain-containing protein, partial [Ramlibacter sp.]
MEHRSPSIGDIADNRPAREQVARIVYASQSRISGSVYAEMERIRGAAMQHNPPLGVHTALLYQSGWFVQWKEGPGDAMVSLMARVARDPRHHSLRVIHSSHGPRLLDGPWSMAIVQRVEKPDDMTLRVLQLRDRIQAGAQYAPPAVWRQLSTPMQVPTAALRAEPDVFQRVLACAAFGGASMELVQWLAHHMDARIVHRRFAGSQDRDISTDLIDFEHDGEALRMVAMARAGLALPLTRAFMPDYSHVMLLLCGNIDRDLTLLKSVVSAFSALPSPPALLGVAANEETHARPASIA